MLGGKIDHNQWPIHRVICIYMKRTRGTGDWLGIQLPKDLQGEVSVGRSVAQLSEHGSGKLPLWSSSSSTAEGEGGAAAAVAA